MKILILSCDTGGGHNSAAYAIAEVLENRHIDYIVTDPLTFGKKRTSTRVASVYNNMIKNIPSAFGTVYKIGDLYSSTKLRSPVYFANSLYAEKLRLYITDNGFDHVICTHLFAMEAITAIRRKTEFHIPCFGILTDYTCIPFFSETRLDGYFIPNSTDLIQELLDKGLKCDHIYGTGIPVSQKFINHIKKSDARAELSIPQFKPMILIMSGSVGCGNILDLCDEALKQGKNEYSVYILVGKNNELKEKINNRYKEYDYIKTVSFTKQVNLYMNAADVMITKPGGLTSTEAAVANVPLIQLLAYTGCETKNLNFFSSRGMSVRADNAKTAISAAWDLILDKNKATQICEIQKKYINPNAADDIVSKVIEYE